MKKKSPRGIPDFGSKGPKSLKSVPPADKSQPLPNQPKPNVAVNVKPAAAATKAGGRRGG
jgi:hypothetical protein